ncbi:DUF2798 domain-containing protein [Ruegeria sp. HKCCD6428]|uniref:DUF2798 domain-containing protein n=2 Tax=unclassified Ruegeria TaxID=2625375 RepID=UPI0035304F48
MDATLTPFIGLEFAARKAHISGKPFSRMPDMIPARFANAIFGLIMSGLMSCIVTGIATVKAVGFHPETLGDWMASWAFCWPIAFTVILVLGPSVKRLVEGWVRPQG